jgi:serine/threonine protein phosphatase 1
MRTWAIGDIHGCASALRGLLAWILPTRQDTLITIGDYIDRGPDSKGVVDQLLALSKSCRLIHLQGNHEELLLHARNSARVYAAWYTEHGGKATLASYAHGGHGLMRDIPQDHLAFFRQGHAYHETATHIFAHALVNPKLPMERQDGPTLRWGRFHNARPHVSGKVLICGHSPQRSGRPRNVGFAINIDTFAHGGGFLTALHLETGRVLQVHEDGRRRAAWIDDFHIDHPREEPWESAPSPPS